MVERRPLTWKLKSCIYPWCLKLTLFSSTVSLVFSCHKLAHYFHAYIHICGSFYPSLHQCLLSLRTNWYSATQYFVLALKYLMFKIFDICVNLVYIPTSLNSNFNLGNKETILFVSHLLHWSSEWNISRVPEPHHGWSGGRGMSC